MAIDAGADRRAAGAVAYVDWMQEGRLSPYVRTLRASGPLTFVEAAQPAGDMSDPPASDLVLVQAASAGMRQTSDLGAGRCRHTAAVGAMLAIPPQFASDIIVDDPHVIRVAALPATAIAPTLAELRPGRDPFDFGRFHREPVVAPTLRRLFDLGFDAAANENETSRLFGDGVALAMLAELVRLTDQRPEPRSSGLARWQERRTVDYLHAHLAEDVALETLAAEARLSPFHFARMFKATTGLPPAAYQRRLRLEQAQRLLVTTDLPITDIALDVGYDAPQAFARMFRAETGTTPSDWRRQRRG